MLRFYLTWKAREYEQHTRFIELAGEINTSMPEYVVHRVAEALNTARKPINGSRILVLGLAYKADVDDERESPSYVLMDLLQKRGAEVAYYDPYVPIIRPTREHSLGRHEIDCVGPKGNRPLRYRADRDKTRRSELRRACRERSVHRGYTKRHGEHQDQTGSGSKA